MSTLQNFEATELATQIRSEYPQLSVHVVPLTSVGYGIVVSWFDYRLDPYCCYDYGWFMQHAEANGFVIDLPDTGMLVQPVEHSFTLKTPGQWALRELVLNKKAPPSKVGRPCKNCHAA